MSTIESCRNGYQTPPSLFTGHTETFAAGLPPPYSPDDPRLDQTASVLGRNRDPHQTSSTRTETAATATLPLPSSSSSPSVGATNQPDISLMDLKLFENCKSPNPYHSVSIIEERFLLIAHSTEGIQVMDLKGNHTDKPKTIIWAQARQLNVISSCGILLVLPERTRKVRCYSLAAIIRLCYGVLGLLWTDRLDDTYPLAGYHHRHMLERTSASASSSTASSSSSPLSSPTSPPLAPLSALSSLLSSSSDGTARSPAASHTSPQKLLTLTGALKKKYIWRNKVALQDYCYKLSNTKDATSMHVYQTSRYVFVALVLRDRISVWQQQRNQLGETFVPLKEFWIPAEAQSVSFADDRVTLRHIVAVFPHGAALIGMKNSKVETVPVDKRLEQLYQVACMRRKYEYFGGASINGDSQHPVNSSGMNSGHNNNGNNGTNASNGNNANNQGSSMASRFIRSHSNPTAITANLLTSPTSPPLPQPSSTSSVSVPSAVSLPRRPLSFDAPTPQWTSLMQLPFYPESLSSLTVEFSIPPSYDTVMTRTPFEATDPVAVPSSSAPQLFLATFGCQSMIIDMKGALFSTQVYSWPEPPDTITFLSLRPNDWYAIGFSKESVNVMHMVSAKSHRVMNGVPIRFLGESNYNGGTLMWSCANGKSYQVYALSSALQLSSSVST